MPARIHPTAVVDPAAELADGVVVGPHAVVGAGVAVGEGTEIGAGAQLRGPTRIGRENRIFPLASVGLEPQDVKYAGEEVRLEIGDRNTVREFCTLHRGTAKGGGVTRIGSDNLFLVGSHVAHDCQVGDRTLFVNNATLAGHVEVGDDATIGAFSSVHQFCRVGRHAYVGGYTVLTMDALPFAKTVGAKPLCYGLNTIGLQRKGFSAEAIGRLSAALRLLLRGGLNTSQAIERIARELGGHPEVDDLAAFVAASRRGVVRGIPGRKGSRGAGSGGAGSGEAGGGEAGG